MRKVLLGVAVVLLAGVSVVVALRGRGGEWTTSNPLALSNFREGLAASMKYYRNDARRFFAKAAEADPNFLIAKALLLDHLDPRTDREGIEALQAELAGADLTPLTARERFLVERALAASQRNLAKARDLMAAFTARYPDDPFGLFLSGQDAVLRGDMKTAKATFGRLLELAPNWVMSYNHLGYIAMAEGAMDEAERMFTTYRFIAPDQANPHDSLGELYLLTGRLDEAEREFELALQARLDFTPSYENLVRVETLRGHAEGVEAALFRARESGAVPPETLDRLACWARAWLAAREGDWGAVAALVRDECPGRVPFPLALRAALFTRDRALETTTLERFVALAGGKQGVVPAWLEVEATGHYLEGIRAAAAGHLERAAELFQQAGNAGSYWGFGRGFTRLSIMATQAENLEKLGRSKEAAAVRAAIRKINPSYDETFARANQVPLAPPPP